MPLYAAASSPLAAQEKLKVIIDQDCSGPGGTDMQAVLAIVNSPKVEVLGITVMTGDAWRDEEVQHTLRLLEIIGRTDIPVVPGAVFPIVNSRGSPRGGKSFTEKWCIKARGIMASRCTARMKCRRCPKVPHDKSCE